MAAVVRVALMSLSFSSFAVPARGFAPLVSADVAEFFVPVTVVSVWFTEALPAAFESVLRRLSALAIVEEVEEPD